MKLTEESTLRLREKRGREVLVRTLDPITICTFHGGHKFLNVTNGMIK